MKSDIKLSVFYRNCNAVVIISAVFKESEKAVQLIIGIETCNAEAA